VLTFIWGFDWNDNHTKSYKIFMNQYDYFPDVMTEHGTERPINRRQHLKSIGASVVGVATLAGCTGAPSDGEGGDGSGGGDSDGGSDGATTSSQDLQEVRFVTVPVLLGAPYYLKKWYDSGRLQEIFAEEGYKLDMELTWEEATIFASGKTEMSTMGTVQGSRLATERDQNISFFGTGLTGVHGYAVKTGGPYDPDNTGSVQASLDKIVADNVKFGIQGWSAGSLSFAQVILEKQFGYSLTEQGDFNVFTSDYSTIPGLIVEEELGAGVVMPMAGGGITELRDGEVKPLWWDRNVFAAQDYGIPMLQNLVTRSEFADNNPGAVRAMLKAWNMGAQKIHEEAMEVAENNYEAFGVQNAEQAKWLVNLYVTADGMIDHPCVLETANITDDRLDSINQIQNISQNLGYLPENWDQQMSFLQPSDLNMG
jgi:hypothetical protein